MGTVPVGVEAGERLVLVGVPEAVHVGAHFERAADELGWHTALADSRRAFDGPVWLRRLNWQLRGHRPSRLDRFSNEVVRLCREQQVACLLTTGIAPVSASSLAAIGRLGIPRLNYLTDDPWNPAHRATWFERALPLYDRVFSPRRANLQDLRALGCPDVRYAPFGYAPDVHYPELPNPEERDALASDVIFAGGGDRDRLPYVAALLEAGVRVGLYGGYWERFAATRPHARGIADPTALRKAIAAAKVALCLVRRANRDGHAMRTFEVAAMGACMLVEDTPEHRELFGEDGEVVVYFGSIDQMLRNVRWLLEADEERRRLALAVRKRILGGGHTYRDRLVTMLTTTGASVGR